MISLVLTANAKAISEMKVYSTSNKEWLAKQAEKKEVK
jgi:hypothetical protein